MKITKKITIMIVVILMIVVGIIGGYYFKTRITIKDEVQLDERKTSITISKDGIMTIYDKDNEASKAIYFSVLGQDKTELFYTSMLSNTYKTDREGYYGLEVDLKKYGSYDIDSIYNLSIEIYWAEYGSIFLGDHSDVYLRKTNGLNQRWEIYFVYGEDDCFYNPDDYYRDKVDSITTLYPIPSVFMQYSSISNEDNLMILNLKDGTTRETKISYSITNQIKTDEPGERRIEFDYCGVKYVHDYTVLPVEIANNVITSLDLADNEEISIYNSSHLISDDVIKSLTRVKRLTYGYELSADSLKGFDNLEELAIMSGNVPLQTIFGGKIPSSLKSIRILDGSTKISNYFFHGASFIDNLYISSSVNKADENAFEGLKNDLTSITISGSIVVPKNFTTKIIRIAPLSTEVCNYFLYNNKNVNNVIMPNSVKEIGVNAFANSALTDIKFSNNLTMFKRDSFTGITGITKLRLPESSTYFAPSVFSSMPNLEEIYFGKNVNTIEAFQFIGDVSLKVFSCPSPNATISISGLLHDTKVKEIHISGKQPIVYIYYKNGDTVDIFPLVDLYVYGDICDNFAKNMKHNLHSVYLRLDESVTKIGNNAFEGTNIFKSLELKNITSIGKEAFKNSRFDTFFSGGKLDLVGDDAFASCDYLINQNKVVLDNILLKQTADELGNVIVDDGIKAIMGYAFYGNVKQVVVPSSVQKVKSTAFFSDTITKITFNGKVALDGAAAFVGAKELKEIYVPLECIDYFSNTAGWSNFSKLYKPL